MISSALNSSIQDLIRRSHQPWLQAVCSVLNNAPESVCGSALIASMPATNNNDAAHCIESVIRESESVMSWKSLAISLELCSSLLSQWQQQHFIELLWSGPTPGSQIPARRIDQVFYDLISSSKREILLVTFAAYKIHQLTDALVKALNRGVRVRLILEFEESSQGQLSMDALNAFPEIVRLRSSIYYWPLDQRERNSSGKPGKLHAKVAVIDDQAVLSSANLTDDAFSRNCELGILFSDGQILERIRWHFDSLCADGTLKLWESRTGVGSLKSMS
jgi:phosphatidylserine/phosphatidylglycerophosphate/cardiolipin synthase-like enzyme